MRLRRIFTAAAFAGLALPAAAVESSLVIDLAPQGDSERRVVNYSCEGQDPMRVEYINAAPNFLAIVTLAGETLLMTTVLTASGAKYVSGQYEWWTDGAEASLYDLTSGPDAMPVFTCLEATETP